MDCPRCGGGLERYRLGEREAHTCPSCRYVGVATDHRSTPRPRESWDDALVRFRERAVADRLDDEAAAALSALDLPGSGRTRARRRAAVGLLYQRLASYGRATKAELLNGVDPATLGYASADTFWSGTARDALRELPGVDPPDPGGATWRYTPPG